LQIESGNFTALGRVGKPIGLTGECRIVPFGETITNASLPFTVWVGTPRDKKQIVLKSIKSAGKGILKGRIEGITDRDSIDLLKNQFLYIETDLLPETEEDEYYFHELEGLKVENEMGELVGKIVAVHNFPTTDAIEIKVQNGEKVIFPFRKETVLAVELGEKVIIEGSFLDDLI
jgi:16S rRNA processing protein RimM